MLRGADPPVVVVVAAAPERMEVVRPMTMGWEVGGQCKVARADNDVLASDFRASTEERLGDNVASDGIPISSSRLGAAVGGGAAMVGHVWVDDTGMAGAFQRISRTSHESAQQGSQSIRSLSLSPTVRVEKGSRSRRKDLPHCSQIQ